MEDDPGLLGLQFWANRTLVYAAQAAAYGAEGLLGIHWRTKVVAPQFLALANFPWNGSLTSADLYTDLCATSFGLTADDAAAAGLSAVWNSIDSYHPKAPPTPPIPPMPPSGRSCHVKKIIGCCRDNPGVWSEMVTASTSSNDQEWCAGWCSKKNYSFAGVEFGVACFCGDAAPPPAAKIDDGVSPTSHCPRQALPYEVTEASQANSLEWCATQCRTQAYRVAGVEFGVTCFCGNETVFSPATIRPMSECEAAKCVANGTENCGGACRMLAYNISCRERSRVPDAPALPAAAMPDTSYTGQERVFMMTPRTVAEGGKLTLKIMALVHDSTRVAAVHVYTKIMGAGGWGADVAAMPTAGSGATGRQVYRAELTLREDSEYYVELATAADPLALQWPAGGAANAQTVVIVPV